MNPVQNPESFGSWVKSRRKRLDLTQAELGKRAGCSAAAVRKFEADERKPSRELAESLARALQIPEAERELFLQSARGIVPDRLRPETDEAGREHPNNLPPLLTSTVNRAQDLSQVTDLIRQASVHLVTLIGPPGIGKTRLSIQCGNELLSDFSDGVWFVDLAEMDKVNFLVPTVARSVTTLNLPSNPSLDLLIKELKDLQLLLILDNFEQIVDQTAMDVARILTQCPAIKMLITSRIPLHIQGEHEYPLPPLSIPPRGNNVSTLIDYEAVQLFVTRTRQHQPKFSLNTENANAIVEICNVLEGVPLALELAAASLRRMTLAEMVSLLGGLSGESWVRQLSTPARDLPERQRTLENVIAWSYMLLTPPQQDLFCKLGLFSGWFDNEAVAAICFDEPKSNLVEVQELLGELSDHSLLVRDNQYGQSCWRMLELIHEYAGLKLSPDVRKSLKPRFIQHYLQRLQAVNQIAEHKQQDAFYHLNVRNLHAALKWAIADNDTDLGFLIAWHLDDLWISHGYSKEGLELLKQLIALPDPSSPEVRISRLEQAADLAWHKHDFETALAFSRETAVIARRNGLQNEFFWFLNRQGRIFIEQELFTEARQVLEESLAFVEVNPATINPSPTYAQLGELSLFEGKLDEAKTHLEKAIVLSKTAKVDEIFPAIAYVDLAEIALIREDYALAFSNLCEAVKYSSVNIRRTLAFLVALVGYLVLIPNQGIQNSNDAAKIIGALERLSEQSGIFLSSFYQKVLAERYKYAQEKLPTGEWDTAYRTGQDLSKEDVLEFAKAVLIIPLTP